jgi:hypothetical protein
MSKEKKWSLDRLCERLRELQSKSKLPRSLRVPVRLLQKIDSLVELVMNEWLVEERKLLDQGGKFSVDMGIFCESRRQRRKSIIFDTFMLEKGEKYGDLFSPKLLRLIAELEEVKLYAPKDADLRYLIGKLISRSIASLPAGEITTCPFFNALNQIIYREVSESNYGLLAKDDPDIIKRAVYEYRKFRVDNKVDSVSDCFENKEISQYAMQTYRWGLCFMYQKQPLPEDLGKAEIYLKHAASCGVGAAKEQLRELYKQLGEQSSAVQEAAESAGEAAAVMAPVALRAEAAGGGAGETSISEGGPADPSRLLASGAEQQGELGSVDESAAFAPLSGCCAEVKGLTQARNGGGAGSGLGPSPVRVDDEEVFSGQCMALAGGADDDTREPSAKRAKTPPPLSLSPSPPPPLSPSPPPPLSGGASDSLGRA